ncbi:MAG: thioredoxin-dependent thiol peroxidase [Spirochaetaceae bacterium]|nr:MAG: thioredoxin-dependent thiol peroxidase [Spirochaetaceae bacterium]
MIEEGTRAPAFTLKNQDGNDVSLSDFAGKKVVIYFYPKDDTPGCTKEACSFRDNHQAILDKGAVILGVSADKESSHTKFREKYSLPFDLLSDPERTVIRAYNAWGTRSMYGKLFEGILRSTVVIDETGTVMKVFPKVSPAKHGEEVLAVL